MREQNEKKKKKKTRNPEEDKRRWQKESIHPANGSEVKSLSQSNFAVVFLVGRL